MKSNVYQAITDKFIAQLEKGIIPWRKPWLSQALESGCYSIVTKKPYSLLNQMILGREGGYMTYNQAHAKGYRIKAGAKAEFVTFWKMYEKEETIENEDGTTSKIKVSIPSLKYYQVFHDSDIEGYVKETKQEIEELHPSEQAEEIVSDYVCRTGLKLTNTGMSQKAYYSPSLDEVVVPCISQYTEVGEYYSTLFHELTHSTGIRSRLDRGLEKAVGFGSESYSKEELVAEIGSAMLVNTCKLDTEKSFKNSVAYVQAWLGVLKGDSKLIVSAASKAEKAVKYILNKD